MPPRLLASSLAAVLLAVACGACGSGATRTETRPGVAPTGELAAEARFVASADAICAALHRQEEPLQRRSDSLAGRESGQGRSELAALSRETVAMARAADARFASLPRPPALAAEIGSLLTGYAAERQDVTVLAEAIAKAESGLQQTAEGNLNRASTVDRGISEKLGLKTCVEDAE